MILLIHWFIYALAILVTAYLLPGIKLDGFGTALLAALVLGSINAIIRPLVILITLPITVLTLGLFLLVINTALIMLTSAMVPGFEVKNFWWGLAFGVILAAVNYILGRIAYS